MEYVGRISNLITTVHQFYNDINPATLSGAIDIVVVKQQNGELACSPFHVRFGKLSLLMPQEKKVEIEINNEVIPYMMKLGEAGEAFFVFETEHEVPEEFQTSPIIQAEEETKEDEEPPYLDIGESKNPTKEQEVASNDVDGFEDEATDKKHNTLRIPAELQSPKMIIEEQVDKVVTKMDPFHHDQPTEGVDQEQKQHQEGLPKNDVYPMEDGATLLERHIPEAITSTTVAKETFIVRPANGDIYSTWMDVTHTSTHTRDGDTPTEPTSPRQGDAESIFLDMAGYKTENDDDKKLAEEQEALAASPTGRVERSLGSLSVSDQEKPKLRDMKETDNKEDKVEEDSQKEKDQEVKEDSNKGELKTDEEEQETSIATSTDKIQEQHNDHDIRLKPGETYRIELSLCGLAALGSDEEKNVDIFNKEQITYDNFVHNPNLLNDRRLIFRHRGRYYASSHAGPLFTSLLLFRKPLTDIPDVPQEDPTQQPQPDTRDTYSFGRGWRQWLSRSSVEAPATTPSTPALTPLEIPGTPGLTAVDGEQPVAENETNETTTFTTTTKTTSVGWSAPHVHPDEEPLDFPQKNYAKTLRLTSEQLKSLNLQKGVNHVCFSVSSAYQGKARCTAKIFFWDYDVNVVISDIDGTITKSDALGHMFNFIGKDWTHTGVAKLYTDVEKNGYQFLYLTSRAIGQADSTRDYLQRVQQNQYQLPPGPVIMSPDRLFTSFHREVIMRKPEVFKMACLRDVRRLFGGRNPFYAGFGNRITDAISYRSVDVPASRIFTIDANGDLKLELLTGYKSSYLALNDLVDQIFPPINKSFHEEFSDYNFWKSPLPEIELPDDLLEDETQQLTTPTSPKTKPKPIVSDPSVLPPQSVVASTPPPPPPTRRQRGILRSFTSRSSSTASSPPSSSSSLSSSASSSLRIAASSSTPALSTTTTTTTTSTLHTTSSYLSSSSSLHQQHHSVTSTTTTTTTTTSTSTDRAGTSPPTTSMMASSPIEPSSPLTSVSSIDDPTTPVDGSSGGIVNKVLGGVFSRTFASKSSTSVATIDHYPEDYEEADDEAFDSTLDEIADEIDMDNIPFI